VTITTSNKGFIVATGTTQADAAQITKQYTIITSGTGGVRAQPASTGDIDYTIENSSGASINFYPSFNNNVHGKSINIAFPILNGGRFTFKCFGYGNLGVLELRY
jgi:hypothetical protein